MTTRPDVPQFGQELSPYIGKIPEPARAAFLAGLERSAAARYRMWAEAAPEHAQVLTACANREDRIADLVSELYPLSDEHQAQIDAVLPDAIERYYELFGSHTVEDQLYLQSEAELQGAMAWVRHAGETDDPAAKAVLEECTALERESSAAVKALLDT